jgi:hypothetical protein
MRCLPFFGAPLTHADAPQGAVLAGPDIVPGIAGAGYRAAPVTDPLTWAGSHDQPAGDRRSSKSAAA